MFTATITSKNFTEGEMQVLVEFSNGTQTKIKAFTVLSEQNLKRQIKDELVRLNELEVFAVALLLGSYDPSDAPVIPPTQAEIDKSTWFRDFNRLEQVTKLNTLGGMPATWSTDLATLTTKVQTDAKKAYIADM
jgi:hypothetical protein